MLKFDQPLICLPKTPYIQRSREWFCVVLEHPFYHMEQKHDPFPADVLLKAAKEVGEEKEKEEKQREKPVKAGRRAPTQELIVL